MAGFSAAELDAALAAGEGVARDPVGRVPADRAAWQDRSQRLRGHLSTRLEFAMAIASYPGFDAPEAVLQEAQKQLEESYVAVRDLCFRVAGIDPARHEGHRPEAFKMMRLASKWACRLWVYEKSGAGTPINVKLLESLLAMEGEGLTQELQEETNPNATGVEVAARVVELIGRFDFFHADHEHLLKQCVDRIYAKVRISYEALLAEEPQLSESDGRMLDDMLRAGADIFASAYMGEAREFRRWFLTVPQEQAAHRRYVAKIVGGLDMVPVYKAFDKAFDYVMQIAAIKSVASRTLTHAKEFEG